MGTFKIKEALSIGWSNFKRRPWYLIGLSAAVFVLFALSLGDMAVSALAYIILGGFIGLLIRHYNGEHIAFDDLFYVNDSRWVSFAFLGLIKTVLIFIGLLAFVVPGIYLAVRWMFAELLVIDQGLRPLEALKKSREMTQGHWWHLFLFAFLASLIMVLGFLVFIVGAFVAHVVIAFAYIKIYRDLQAAPPTHDGGHSEG